MTETAVSPSVPVTPPVPRPSALTLVEVVFPIPAHRRFDYLVPDSMASVLRPGHRVAAPFGRRGNEIGVVTRRYAPGPEAVVSGPLKPLGEILDPVPALSEKDLALAQWLSERYFCSIGEAVFGVLPVGKHRPPKRDGRSADVRPRTPPPSAEFALMEDQKRALEAILPSIRSGGHETFLIWGVAAAGKTEIYINAVAEALRSGRSAIFLVPEIGLTPQTEILLRARFGPLVEVWHSEISRGDRWRAWQRALSGECRVMMGPRSALFAPMQNLGLIVVDEEHDASYKEDSSPRYHARETALEKARLHGATVILGSATPSMESYCRARDGVFRLIEMPNRVMNRPAPAPRLVDLRQMGAKFLSDPLVQAVEERLEKKEQVLLLLNRRGFATYVLCRACGWEARCPDCAVSLVYHKEGTASLDDLPGLDSAPETLRCHYCAHRRPLPAQCPECRQATIKLKGRGTQRIVADVQVFFPKARVLRWDRDTTRRRGAHAQAFDAVHADAVDIVVGTQMIAQGLDFPRVTLVGVLDADRSLRFPDFRAGERTFQLLTQVSGRAGRADRPGEVIVQTRNPQHYAVQAAYKMDYRAFAEEELLYRQEMFYPPFSRLAQLLLRGRNAEKVEKAAAELTEWLERLGLPPDVQVLGPAPSFHVLRAGVTQWQVLLKTPPERMDEVLRRLRDYKPAKSVALAVDVDPEDLQ